MKFEEHCEPKGKIVERICPQLEQCLSTPNQSKSKKQLYKQNFLKFL